jgi:hypothetical protein
LLIEDGVEMSRRLFGVFVAVVLLAVGWTVGRAQAVAPDFELVVYGAQGDTQIVCRSGCTLAYRQDSGKVDRQAGKKDVGFACGEATLAAHRCEAFFAGFVQR